MNRENLEGTVVDPKLHWRLLKALAHLEGQGHQKLLRYVRRTGTKDRKILRHLAEEARHSKLLDGFAESLCTEQRYIPSSAVKGYLKRIELFILRKLKKLEVKSDIACYLLTTLVVEERALSFYPTYESILKSFNSPYSIKPILDDEEDHLKMMKAELGELDLPESIIIEARLEEEKLFHILLTSLVKEKDAR